MYEDKIWKRQPNEQLEKTERNRGRVWKDKCDEGLHKNRKRGNKNVHHESKRTAAKRFNTGLQSKG